MRECMKQEKLFAPLKLLSDRCREFLIHRFTTLIIPISDVGLTVSGKSVKGILNFLLL